MRVTQRTIGVVTLAILAFGVLATFAGESAEAQLEAVAPGTCQVEVVVETNLSQRQCDALVALYWATRGPEWTEQRRWNTAIDPCDWGGVRCVETDGYDVIEQVIIHENNLSGYLPEQIDGLWGLRKLRLSANNITGELPSHVGHLQSLEVLDLSGNALSGAIPSRIGDLPRLRVLNLSGNDLSGNIPTELVHLASLVQLRLDQNDCLVADLQTVRFVAALVETSDLSECIANTITTSCLQGNGRVDVEVINNTWRQDYYSVKVGHLAARSRLIPAGGSATVTVTGRSDGPLDVFIIRGTGFTHQEQTVVDCDPDPDPVSAIAATVSCVGDAGEDRLVHVVSTNNGAATATYLVYVNNMAPRRRVIDPGRSKGAPVIVTTPGSVVVQVTRDGVDVHRETIDFTC